MFNLLFRAAVDSTSSCPMSLTESNSGKLYTIGTDCVVSLPSSPTAGTRCVSWAWQKNHVRIFDCSAGVSKLAETKFDFTCRFMFTYEKNGATQTVAIKASAANQIIGKMQAGDTSDLAYFAASAYLVYRAGV